jgi:pSer/pThr/pTyr-binding forkhead associated (FHA) protein
MSERPPPLKTIPLQPERPTAAEAEPTLIVVEGLEPGRRFALRGDSTSIGRGGDNHVVLPSPAVSNEHARVAVRDGQFWIEDLRSTNGVAVNGHRLRVDEPRLLGNGDSIRISDHLLFFHRGGAQQAQVASAIEIDHATAAQQADDLLRQLREPPAPPNAS